MFPEEYIGPYFNKNVPLSARDKKIHDSINGDTALLNLPGVIFSKTIEKACSANDTMEVVCTMIADESSAAVEKIANVAVKILPEPVVETAAFIMEIPKRLAKRYGVPEEGINLLVSSSATLIAPYGINKLSKFFKLEFIYKKKTQAVSDVTSKEICLEAQKQGYKVHSALFASNKVGYIKLQKPGSAELVVPYSTKFPRIRDVWNKVTHSNFIRGDGGALMLPRKPATISSIEAIRLVEKMGYKRVPDGGKGGHIKLVKPGSPMIIVSGGKKEISRNVINTIWKSLAHSLTKSPLLALSFLTDDANSLQERISLLFLDELEKEPELQDFMLIDRLRRIPDSSAEQKPTSSKDDKPPASFGETLCDGVNAVKEVINKAASFLPEDTKVTVIEPTHLKKMVIGVEHPVASNTSVGVNVTPKNLKNTTLAVKQNIAPLKAQVGVNINPHDLKKTTASVTVGNKDYSGGITINPTDPKKAELHVAAKVGDYSISAHIPAKKPLQATLAVEVPIVVYNIPLVVGANLPLKKPMNAKVTVALPLPGMRVKLASVGPKDVINTPKNILETPKKIKKVGKKVEKTFKAVFGGSETKFKVEYIHVPPGRMLVTSPEPTPTAPLELNKLTEGALDLSNKNRGLDKALGSLKDSTKSLNQVIEKKIVLNLSTQRALNSLKDKEVTLSDSTNNFMRNQEQKQIQLTSFSQSANELHSLLSSGSLNLDDAFGFTTH